MTVFGPRALVDLAVPSGWDAAALERIRLQDGTTIAEVIGLVTSAVNLVNAELSSDPLIGGITYKSTERAVRYRDGGATTEMSVHTEYGLPTTERGATEGHMLPRVKRDLGLDWTWDYLNDAIMDDIMADIQNATDRIRNTFQKAALTRLFSNAHNTVETSGYDVGLADGNQSTVVWTPPPFDGASFLSTHAHYNERAAVSAANLALDAKHLAEHGHQGPYVLYVAEADRATYTALTEYIPRASEGVRYGATQDIAVIGEDYIGVIPTDYGSLYVRPVNRIPTAYYALVKSYGFNHPRNPLRWWFNAKFGAGVVPLPGKTFRTFPIEGLMLYAEYGFGGNVERTSAACTEIGSGGTYTVPTIS
jgi:hypothetical protein